MKTTSASTLVLERITGTKAQIFNLYELLKKREKTISHKILPSFKEHTHFVRNHPYRIWYLIKSKNQFIGSVYLLNNNCLGISCLMRKKLIISDALSFILKKMH